jgi:hypothetical protein
MERIRDAGTTERLELREGRTARVEFRDGIIEGRIVEVRVETPDVTRVVVSPFGEDVEVDTDAERVEVRDPREFCASCGVRWEESPTYRCPNCGTDLVED